MKISLITTCYPNWLKYIYDRNENLDKKEYNQQFNVLLHNYAGAFYSFYSILKELGHETQLILPDIEPLQKKWNEENNYFYNEKWEYLIALEQIKLFEPDIIFACCDKNYMGNFYGKLKEIAKKKLIVWFSSPIKSSYDFRYIDLIISSSDQFVAQFRKMGINSELLKAGFDPNVLNYLSPNINPIYNLSFIGSLSGNHSNREKLLTNLNENNLDFSLFGNGFDKKFVDRLKDLYNAKTNKFDFFKKIIISSPYKSKFKGEVFGIDMYQTLRDSKMTLNSHIDAANGMVGNMRMFEATGVGTCLINDNGYNLKELFEPDYEIVVYNSAEEASEKIKWLLNNENERKKIAEAGQKRTLKNHNYKDRTIELNEIFIKYI